MKKGYKHSNSTKEKISISKIGIKRKSFSKEWKQKISLGMTGEKHWNWKGDLIKNKIVIHQRIRKILGQTRYCEICKRTDRKDYDWSNKDHKYSLNTKDWQRLCVSCHRKYDYTNHLSNIGTRWGSKKNKF